MSNILLLSATEIEHKTSYIGDHEIHITGIGKVNAAARTAALLCKYKPDLVINFGSCGAIKDYKIGEILKVGTVINDIDTKGLTKDRDIFLQGKGEIICCTTDHFFDHTNKPENQSRIFRTRMSEIDIVDMELYGIATACSYDSTLLYSYKWVSDDGDISKWKDNAAIGFENFVETFKNTFL